MRELVCVRAEGTFHGSRAVGELGTRIGDADVLVIRANDVKQAVAQRGDTLAEHAPSVTVSGEQRRIVVHLALEGDACTAHERKVFYESARERTEGRTAGVRRYTRHPSHAQCATPG